LLFKHFLQSAQPVLGQVIRKGASLNPMEAPFFILDNALLRSH
jgi:hypothetical protein